MDFLALACLTSVITLILFSMYVTADFISCHHTGDNNSAKNVVLYTSSISITIGVIIQLKSINTDIDSCFIENDITAAISNLFIIALLNIAVVVYEYFKSHKVKYKKEHDAQGIVYTDPSSIIQKIENDYATYSVELNSDYFDFDVELDTASLLSIYIIIVSELGGDTIVRLNDVNIDKNSKICGTPQYPTIPNDYHTYTYHGNFAEFIQTAKNDNKLSSLYRIMDCEMDGDKLTGYNLDFVW